MDFTKDKAMDLLKVRDRWQMRKDTCPNCHTATSLSVESNRVIWPEVSQAGSVTPAERVELQVWDCTYCDKTTTLILIFSQGEGDDAVLVEVRQVWPDAPPRELPPEAPQDVRSLFREASIAENAGALRGAAALYRAAVEQLVADQGISEGNLEKRIDAMKAKGLDDDLVDDLHDARLTGNWSIHQGVSFSAEEVADVARLISDAVSLLYVQPAERERMRAARRARREGSQD